MNRKNSKPALVASAMLGLLISGSAAVAAQETIGIAPAAGDVVPGEYLVRFEDSVDEARIAEINARFGAEVVSRMLDGKILLIRLADPESAADIAVLYAATPGVAYIEPNLIFTTQGGGTVGTEVQ